MSFPNLVATTGGKLHSKATGTPVNGVNTFNLALPVADVEEDWLKITVIANGDSVTGATYTNLSVDKTQISINFAQTGADTATVEAELVHTAVR